MSTGNFLRTALCAGLLAGSGTAAAFEVRLTPPDPRPGDILQVEVIGLDNPVRAECLFRATAYPLYPVAPGRLRALIGLPAHTPPGEYPLRVRRKGFLLPAAVKTALVTVPNRKFTHQRITMTQQKARLPGGPSARDALQLIRRTLQVESRKQLWRGRFLRPAKGRQTSDYGHSRTVNDKASWAWHKGVDYSARLGSEIIAPAAGRIILRGHFPIQGRLLILDHGQGLMSAFMHLKTFRVDHGDTVRAGARLGDIGTSGFSTAPHLHWGVYLHGAPVDPVPLLERKL
ncbi:MAG: M23 family metallopeptidase [Elusimicrobiota bacterium]